jgi:hypothetical protein
MAREERLAPTLGTCRGLIVDSRRSCAAAFEGSSSPSRVQAVILAEESGLVAAGRS